MGTTLLVIAAIIVLAAVIVWILAARQPAVFAVERSIVVNAPPQRIHALINNFHNWGRWSPYEHRDPSLKRTFSGAGEGKGAVYDWEGNKNVGTGRMEILETDPSSNVTIKLDFLKPFEAHNKAEFLFHPQGNATSVTWRMSGPHMCMGRIMSVFMNFDRMVGKDFETGLVSLKQAAESGA
jgi:glycerol-3-phosphate acyltransferase PlsY